MLKQLRSNEDQNIIEKGFTLVELLIVIVILGILAGIVVFAVGNLTSNAKSNACATEKSTIVTADEAYKAQNPTIGYTDTAGLVSGRSLEDDTVELHDHRILGYAPHRWWRHRADRGEPRQVHVILAIPVTA